MFLWGISPLLFGQGCLPEGITFSTQAQIDNFQSDYPGCFEIEGDVTITGNDITDLNGLSVLTAINGAFIIDENPELEDLNGLGNLTTLGSNLFLFKNNVNPEFKYA